jgi:hypothetical protein
MARFSLSSRFSYLQVRSSEFSNSTGICSASHMTLSALAFFRPLPFGGVSAPTRE